MHGLGLRRLIRCLGSSGSARGKGVRRIAPPRLGRSNRRFQLHRQVCCQAIAGARNRRADPDPESGEGKPLPRRDTGLPVGLLRPRRAAPVDGRGGRPLQHLLDSVRAGTETPSSRRSSTPGCFLTRLPMQAWAGSSTSPWPTPRPSPGCPISGARGRWRRV